MAMSLTPRANVFLLVNLGCEMLYVIDQRLKAQQISEEKSIQVIHDITAVLLDPKFIDSIIVGSTHINAQLLTADHCKFMLNDIATCSLMRLDEKSMDKLWNLMTVIYKWQLFLSKYQHHMLDITFRHLTAVSKLYPDEKRTLLVDFTKNTLLDFWNNCSDEEQLGIYHTSQAWLQCFNMKISLLIRLGFQALDGTFFCDVDAGYYQEFVDSIGDNIYMKSMEILAQRRAEMAGSSGGATRNVDQLAELLNIQQNCCEELSPIDASNFQKQFETNLQQCNILFEDLDVNETKQKPSTSHAAHEFNMNLFADRSTYQQPEEFVELKPLYNRGADSSNTAPATHIPTGLNKDLLELYSKMN